MSYNYLKFFTPEVVAKANRLQMKNPPPWIQLIYEFRLLRLKSFFSAQDLDLASGSGLGTVSQFEKGGNVTLKTLCNWLKYIGDDSNMPRLISDHEAMPNGFETIMESEANKRIEIQGQLDQAHQEMLSLFRDQVTVTGGKYDHRNNKALKRLQQYLIMHKLIQAVDCQKI